MTTLPVRPRAAVASAMQRLVAAALRVLSVSAVGSTAIPV